MGSPEFALSWQPLWTVGSHLLQSRMALFWPAISNHHAKFWSAAAFPSALTAGLINGEHVVVLGTTGGQIEVRSATDGRLTGVFDTDPLLRPSPARSKPSEVIRAIAIMQEAAAMSATADGTIRITDMSTGEVVKSTWKLAETEVVAVEAVAIAGRTIAALTATDTSITIIALPSGNILDRIPPEESAITLDAEGQSYRLRAMAKPGPDLLAPHIDHIVRVTDFNGEPRGALMGHTDRISALTTMALDGHPVAVTASFDGTVRFWDVRALLEIERLDLPGPVQAVVPVGMHHLAVLCCGEVIVYARRNARKEAS